MHLGQGFSTWYVEEVFRRHKRISEVGQVRQALHIQHLTRPSAFSGWKTWTGGQAFSFLQLFVNRKYYTPPYPNQHYEQHAKK